MRESGDLTAPPHALHVSRSMMGRLGQKSGAGYYRYDPATRQRAQDPEVGKLIC
jgi:3-hydroxyacyl-CoA dehydrogenase